MTASLLDQVPLSRIGDRAHAARPGRVLLTVIIAILFAAGWVAFRTLAIAWLGVAFTGAAVAEGWIAAREDARRKQVRRGPARAG
jgi:hypothetical protein